jgi:phage minor structural protein
MIIAKDRTKKKLGFLTKAKEPEVRERLNGESLLSFEIPFDDYEVSLLELEGFLELEGQNYVIKSIEPSDSGSKSFTVRAVHVYIELLDEFIDRIIVLSGVSARQALEQALQGTEFQIGIVEPTGLNDIDLSEMSSLKAVQAIREKWDCDLWYDNYVVNLGEKGIQTFSEIRYGKNLKSLRRPSSSDNVITRLFVYGKDGLTIEGINGGKKYIDSPNIGLYHRPKCADIRFDDIGDPNELLAEGEKFLSQNDKIDLAYQVDFYEMKKLGFDGEEINLGDEVTLTHLPFNIQTIGSRVVDLVRFPLSKRPSVVTLSSFIETSIDDFVSLKKRQLNFERYANNRYKDLEIAKKNLQEETAALNEDLLELLETQSDFENEINSTFRDGIINEAESKAIGEHKKQLEKEKADVDAEYTKTYNNTYLVIGAVKTALSNAKTAYNNAYNDLLTIIDAVIVDKTITDTERATISAKFTALTNALFILRNSLEDARAAIEAKVEANAKGYTDTQIEEVNTSIGTLQQDIELFSADNQLTRAEANTLKNALNQVNAESTDLLNVSNTLGITTERTNYSSALTNLTNVLNSWVDQTTYPLTITSTQRNDVKAKFESVQSTKSILINKINAIRQANAEKYTDTNYKGTKDAVNNGQIYIKDKYGQIIVNEEGLLTQEIAGYGIADGGIITIQNRVSTMTDPAVWIRPTGDIVVSPMTVILPNNKKFVIPETRFNNQQLGANQGDFDGWEFKYLYVDSTGVVRIASAGTSGGWKVFPPNPPAGSVRIGYLLVGYGTESPDGMLNDTKEYNNGIPVFKEKIYHDIRYRDERLVRVKDGEIIIGGAPYGTQLLTVTCNPGEYKTYYIPLGKGKRSANVSISLSDGTEYDNYNYGANLTVGRKAANDADGKGRPIFGSFTDVDGVRAHVQGRRNISPYGIHILSPRVWNKSYTMLYDADLIPDPTNAEIISLKLVFYNYGGSVETFNLRLNWHAY